MNRYIDEVTCIVYHKGKQYGGTPQGLIEDYPFLSDAIGALPDYVAPEKTVMQKIADLERQQTPRRLREAALGDVDSLAVLKSIDDGIRELRLQGGMDAGKIKKKGVVAKMLG